MMNKSDYVFQVAAYRGFNGSEVKKLNLKELKFLFDTVSRVDNITNYDEWLRRKDLSADEIRKKFLSQTSGKKNNPKRKITKLKLWRKFNGLRYQVWYKTKSKASKDIYIQSLKKSGYLVRTVRHKDGWQIYRRKKK